MKEKKMTGKMFKQVVSFLLLVSMMFSVSVGNCANVYAEYYNGKNSQINNDVKKYLTDLKNELFKLEASPIQEGVDVGSDEIQSIIVEFKADPIAVQEAILKLDSRNEIKEYSSLGQDVDKEHEVFNEFISGLSGARSGETYIRHSYTYVYNGVSMRIKGTEIQSLLDSGVVKAIWPNSKVQLIDEEIPMDFSGTATPYMADSVGIIGSDVLNASGLTGKGVKVGVLDTGIDYNHPDLEEVYKGGYDLVDDDSDPMETTYKYLIERGYSESDSIKYSTSHGTHVSGTIAATGKNTDGNIKVTGVAPEVELYAYRVLGIGGQGSTEDIVAGIEKAVLDGMNVLNLSLGAAVNNTLFPTSIAVNNAVIAGVVCCVANGNDGPALATLGAPGCAPLALSVGATTNGIRTPKYLITLSDDTKIEAELLITLFEGFDLSDATGISYCGYGGEHEFYGYDDDYNKINLAEGKIVLVDRGNDIALYDKAVNAKKAGAIGIIIANNTDDAESGLYLGEFTSNDLIPGFFITKTDGELLKEKLEINTELYGITRYYEPEDFKYEIASASTGSAITGSAISVTVTVTDKITTLQADALATFSSRGPSSDMTIKPDVCAPGQGILSTFPSFINDRTEDADYSMAYGRISGTSMATPHVAGVAALMLEKDITLTPSDIKTILANTCEPLIGDYGINEMGAGRINAIKAINAVEEFTQIRVIDTTRSLDENKDAKDIEYISGSLSFDLISKADESRFSERAVQIINGTDNNKIFSTNVRFLKNEELIKDELTKQDAEVQDAYGNGVTIEIPESITVLAGESEDLAVKINIPANSDSGRYEGVITYTNINDANEVYRMPFSVMYTVPGFNEISLSRPAATNNLEWVNYAMLQGVTANVSVNSLFNECYVYIADYDTKEIFGYVGYADLFGAAPGGNAVTFGILNSRLSYFPTAGIDKDVEPITHALKEGKYTISFVGTDNEGDYHRRDINFLVDNTPPEVSLDIPVGIVEFTDEDFVYNEQYETDICWISGNLTDNSISELKDIGYDIPISETVVVPIFVNGAPSNAGGILQKDGSFEFGIEPSDFYDENPYTNEKTYKIMEVAPHPVDIATSLNLYKIPRHYLMMEGTMYMQVETNAASAVKENDVFTTTISANNVTNVSRFEFEFLYNYVFDVEDIKLTDEFNKFLSDNNYTANSSFLIRGNIMRTIEFVTDIFDSEGKRVNIAVEKLPLYNIKMKYADDNESEFYREYFELEYIAAYKAYDDSEDEYAKYDAANANMSYIAVDAYVDVIKKDSWALISEPGEGFYDDRAGLYTKEDEAILNANLSEYIWIEDSNGNRYNAVFNTNPTIFAYIFEGLPITEEYLTVYSELPGHFKKIAKFVPSRKINGELKATNYYLLGVEFYSPVFAGDASDDGVIDVLDAEIVAKYWNQNVDFRKVGADFNFDGVVDKNDMHYVIKNFGIDNEQVYFNNKPIINKTTADGKTLDDILREIDYVSETSNKDFDIIVEGQVMPELYLHVGDSHECAVTTVPEDITIDAVWSTKNSDVAEVDQNGVITAVNPGVTYIRVRDKISNKVASVSVTVYNNEDNETGVSAVPAQNVINMYVGDSKELSYSIDPSNYVVSEIEYISSNRNLEVKNGVVKAKAAGKSYITAIFDGKAYAMWEVTAGDRSYPDGGYVPENPSTGSKDNIDIDTSGNNVTVTIETKPIISGTNADVKTDEKAIISAIEAIASEGYNAVIKIKADLTADVKNVNVTIADNIISMLLENNIKLNIETTLGTITVYGEVLKAILEQGKGDVVFSVNNVDNEKALTAACSKKIGAAPVFDFKISVGGKAVTDFKGGNAELSVPYSSESAEDIVVWYINDDEKLIEVESAYYDEKSKNVIFEVSHFSLYAVGSFPFKDVKSNAWYYDSVVFSYNSSLMSGTASSVFAPDADTTRAMLLTLLYRLENTPAVYTAPIFEDVEDNAWYTDAIVWASENEIAGGYGDKKFGPNDKVTREQIAVILYNYAKFKGLDLTGASAESYDDYNKISQWAQEAVKWAIKEDLLQGYNNSLNPDQNATRAQIAAILERFITK